MLDWVVDINEQVASSYRIFAFIGVILLTIVPNKKIKYFCLGFIISFLNSSFDKHSIFGYSSFVVALIVITLSLVRIEQRISFSKSGAIFLVTITGLSLIAPETNWLFFINVFIPFYFYISASNNNVRFFHIAQGMTFGITLGLVILWIYVPGDPKTVPFLGERTVTQTNEGFMLAYAIIWLVANYQVTDRKRLSIFLLVFFGSSLLALSTRAVIFGLILILGFLIYRIAIRRHLVFKVIALSVVVVVASLTFNYVASARQVEDKTLISQLSTSRIELFADFIEIFEARSFIGHGYGYSSRLMSEMGFYRIESYPLELFFDIGVIGILFTVIFWLFELRKLRGTYALLLVLFTLITSVASYGFNLVGNQGIMLYIFLVALRNINLPEFHRGIVDIKARLS